MGERKKEIRKLGNPHRGLLEVSQGCFRQLAQASMAVMFAKNNEARWLGHSRFFPPKQSTLFWQTTYLKITKSIFIWTS